MSLVLLAPCVLPAQEAQKPTQTNPTNPSLKKDALEESFSPKPLNLPPQKQQELLEPLLSALLDPKFEPKESIEKILKHTTPHAQISAGRNTQRHAYVEELRRWILSETGHTDSKTLPSFNLLESVEKEDLGLVFVAFAHAQNELKITLIPFALQQMPSSAESSTPEWKITPFLTDFSLLKEEPNLEREAHKKQLLSWAQKNASTLKTKIEAEAASRLLQKIQEKRTELALEKKPAVELLPLFLEAAKKTDLITLSALGGPENTLKKGAIERYKALAKIFLTPKKRSSYESMSFLGNSNLPFYMRVEKTDNIQTLCQSLKSSLFVESTSPKVAEMLVFWQRSNDFYTPPYLRFFSFELISSKDGPLLKYPKELSEEIEFIPTPSQDKDAPYIPFTEEQIGDTSYAENFKELQRALRLFQEKGKSPHTYTSPQELGKNLAYYLSPPQNIEEKEADAFTGSLLNFKGKALFSSHNQFFKEYHEISRFKKNLSFLERPTKLPEQKFLSLSADHEVLFLYNPENCTKKENIVSLHLQKNAEGHWLWLTPENVAPFQTKILAETNSILRSLKAQKEASAKNTPKKEPQEHSTAPSPIPAP